ncbi:MAG TPA: TetR/AcrR family transcriptional regulator [Solirubrobacteraceae bacterium]
MTRPTTTRRPGARGPSAPAPGAKTARGLATQAALVRAAQEVFERDGFLDARIADITAAARTATGSFYTYFNGKEEIFLAVVKALDEVGLHPPSLEYVAKQHADVADLVADITAHHRAYLEAYHRNAKMMRVVEEVTNVSDSFRRERTARAQTWIEGSRDAVVELQRQGRADPGLDPLLAARALSLMLSRSAYVTFVLEQEGEESIDGLAQTLTRLWVNALKVPPT